MKKKLLEIIDEFGKLLTIPEYNQYVTKLRDYLIPYIIEKKGEDLNVDTIFKDEFTRSDVINATVYYVLKNQNVESISAIDDYLIAINRLFDELLFDKYPNPTLMKFKPFTSLNKKVEEKLTEEGIMLKKREVNPSIDRDQFEFIVQYLKKNKSIVIQSNQIKIIIKLMLLYGFSHDKIAEMKIEDYNTKQKTLKVEYTRVMKRNIYLELPYSLATELNEYLNKRTLIKEMNSELLFVTLKNNKIRHNFLARTLSLIKQEYYNLNKRSYEKNQFTPTGLQKYAIIQMILAGMNQSVITDFTGQKQDIYNDCQNEVNRIKEFNRNRYINYKIRGINTYDEIK